MSLTSQSKPCKMPCPLRALHATTRLWRFVMFLKSSACEVCVCVYGGGGGRGGKTGQETAHEHPPLSHHPPPHIHTQSHTTTTTHFFQLLWCKGVHDVLLVG